MNLSEYVKDVKDFPEKGIIFKDITPLLSDQSAFKHTIERISEQIKELDFDIIVAMESRGFLFAPALCYKLEKGLVLVRKPGKLPRETIEESYDLEYGSNTLQMHADSLKPGNKVLIFDDVLATGGTAEATAKLVKRSGAQVAGFSFLIELEFLNGKEKLCANSFSVLKY